MLKHYYQWCMKYMQYEGWGWVANTAYGKAKYCIDTLIAVIFLVSWWNNALTKLLFCVGRIIGSSIDG